MKTLTLSVVAAAAALLAAPALADPVEWTFSGTFADGGAISGSYVYDADTNDYSSVNVTTGAGAILPTPETYVARGPFGGSNGFALETATGDIAGERLLVIDLVGNMTNAGGVITVDNGSNTFEGVCPAGGCGGVLEDQRAMLGATITGVPVPVAAVPTMTEWAMIGLTGLLAAAGAVMVSRRRRFI